MRERSIDERIIHATASHGYALTVDIRPEHEMEKVLYAVDELTGLIGAVAIMRPSQSVANLELKSVKKIFSKNTLSLSFEVFPPKNETAFENVKHATEEIAKLHPSFMSVTYGAGGGTSKYTLDIARQIKEQYDVPSLAHLTCVSSTKETVHQRIRDIQSAGIQNIMALRGDIPTELQNADRAGWVYRHAVELVRELKEYGT